MRGPGERPSGLGESSLYRRRWLEERPARLDLSNIFTNGLPQEDADRYHVS